ncbi:MarR family winged helix-turn-helix transcriptional regulator [uncultured Dysosmobacter sp.]|uniref:MarR family winged helix-turn-helix transcriptional regulator n=1 Tax=uncultured Dysosmobacter sp. TaxID=2591384 RepID=UPI002615A2D4|nr:MarR family transcriptional regulator [uncultured Dysosmobacter sp.]
MIERFEKFTLSIFEISRCWHKLAEEELSPYGLKGPYATYLTVMYRYEDGITGPELCELCGKDKSDLSRAVAVLQEKGLVVKEVVNKSLYRGLFKLTERGRAVAEQLCKRASLAVELAGGDLSGETRETFYRVLTSITANLKALSKEGLPQ